MHEQRGATPFADVNLVLEHFRAKLPPLLGEHFLGMYAVGSLALGDFDPATSDIDWIVVTDTDLEERLVHDLQTLHTQFAESPSPWATKIEAVYVPYAALCAHPPTPRTYPQLEKGTPLGHMVLEPGWVFQCWTLRERGIVVAGPHPHLLAAPIKAQDMAAAVVAIAGEWLTLARHDPSWLVWMQEYHPFVIQTLCRLLYSLALGEVASKPRATAWAEQVLAPRWKELIQRSRTIWQHAGQLLHNEVADTIAFIEYTVTQGQRGMR